MARVQGSVDEALERACARWEESADFSGLKRWLDRELTSEGCPKSLPTTLWLPHLKRIHRARAQRSDGWPRIEAAKVSGWLWRVLHFTRPDGAPVFGSVEKSAANLTTLKALAAESLDPGLSKVVGGWSPSGKAARGALPSPRRSESGQVLASLRNDWTNESSWCAVDARLKSEADAIEVASLGKPWISGAWLTPPRAKAAKPSCWFSNSQVDCIEWTFKSGDTRITRTVVNLRFMDVAIVAQQEEGPATASGLHLPIAPGMAAAMTDGQRSVTLGSPRKKATVIPFGLPALPYESDKGKLVLDDDSIQISNGSAGRRRWLPSLIAWGKAPTQWRVLTVTENMKKCDASVAFGARVAWGPGRDGLLIYRSLAKPGLRAVLGYQTRARFAIGRFTHEGKVVPLLTLD